MDKGFMEHVERLHPSLERLVAMRPVTILTIPTRSPRQCVYLFTEDSRYLYAGRTNSFRVRMCGHSSDGATHHSAVFAFKLAREETGNTRPTYATAGSRASLSVDPEFANAFRLARQRVRAMELWYVEETDPFRQALLEMYVSLVLKTPYNAFNTYWCSARGHS